MTNVLLTCAGRRNYLVSYFRTAIEGRGQIFGADSRCDSPALSDVDRAFKVPPIEDPAYCDELLEICARYEVALLIPLNDLELPILAAAYSRFAAVGTTALVSAPAIVETCFDKWATFQFLTKHGIPTPRTYLSVESALAALNQGDLSFPVVLKPRWGSASIGVELACDARELELGFELAKNRLARTILATVIRSEASVLIQERLKGQEVGLDVINDLSGEHRSTCARLKLGMRAGETDRARTLDTPEFSELGARIGRSLGHRGILDCDMFIEGGSLSVLEMNPRFGGGYPFSHAAGANVPGALVRWLKGETVCEEWLKVSPGVTAAKCDGLVLIK